MCGLQSQAGGSPGWIARPVAQADHVPRLAARTSSSESEEEIEDEREDRGVVDERERRVEENGATDLRAGHGRVGDLEAHPDCEGEVGEVEVARRGATGKLDAADSLLVLR